MKRHLKFSHKILLVAALVITTALAASAGFNAICNARPSTRA
ncbi:hypothetical protein [Pseudomonas sp. BAV 4579]|nr:hypothetical protein [Pseudomonas sp. BAV 4579]